MGGEGVGGQVTVGGHVGQVGGEGVGGQVTVGGHVGQVGGEGVGGQVLLEVHSVESEDKISLREHHMNYTVWV